MTYTHKAVITPDGPPYTECGGTGRCVMRSADVDCPDCLQLDADRQARVAEADDVMTTAEVADVFRVSAKTPGQWVNAGLITCDRKRGRKSLYKRAEIEALLAQGHATPPFLKGRT